MRLKLVLFLLTLSPVISATDYYVKNGGNNNADGKSDATAWATISKVNSTSLQPGDVVFFRCGDRWRETLEVPRSGSSSAYIKFTKYGQGLNPKIVGSNSPSGWTNTSGNIWKSTSTFQNPKDVGYGSADIYFEFSDNSKKRGNYKSSTTSLTAEFQYTYSASYIYVYSPADPSTRYYSVEVPQRWSSVYTNNQSYLHFDGIDFNYGAFTGIDGTTQNDVRDYTGCIVENCEISCVGGITPEQYGFGTNIVFSDMVIRNCLFYYCGRRAISMNMQNEGSFTVENVLIEKNTFRWGSHTTALDLTCNNGGSGTAGYNGIVFRYNLVEEEQGVSVPYPVNQMWFQNYGGTGSITNVYIYSNIFKYWRENCIATEGVKGNMFIYNNTFYENNSAGGSYGYTYGIYSDNDVNTFRMNIKNNIFYTSLSNDNSGNGAFIVPYGLQESHYICDNNLFYRINNNLRVWLVNGTGYYMDDITTVRSVLRWELNSPNPANPLFVSPTDLHLQTGSPALGAGVALPEVVADFSGTAFNNPPNIGCYSSSGLPPALSYVSSVIQNASPLILEITFNLTLANIVPSTSAFTVKVNSNSRNVSSVAVSGTKVSLTLASPVVSGDVVTVAYTKPSTNPLQTSAGVQATSFSDKNVTNNVAAPAVPAYVSSQIANATPSVLEMTYNMTLANIVPAASAFTVRVNSTARTVSSVAVSGTKVSLTLASPVVYGDVITVAYTKPATNPLQTSADGQAATISAQNVTNNVAAPAVPAYVSSQIANATPSVLEMTYNMTLANIAPAASAFTVRVNSTARTVASVAVSGTKVSLTLASPVVYGDVVTVAYTKPATNPLQTSAGGQAATISAQNVTNNVAAPAVPAYVSSQIANATPSVLEMTYNMNLANIVPAASAFTVSVNSTSRSVSSVAVSGTKVSLTLASPVVYSDVVTVAYTKPATNPLQTSAGGQAASISAQNVSNNVAAPGAPAYISSLIANATPSVLEITFSMTLANIIPAASAFNVTVNSTTRTVSSVSVSGTKVSLTLASPVIYGNVITVSYTKPSTNPLQTSAGGQVASFSNQNVTNNLAAPAVPAYVSSLIANATPSVLEMTYNMTLANIVPAASAFTVSVNSTARTVSSVTVSGTKVSLTLASPVIYGDVVTVAYTKPAANPLQTSAGGQAATISAQNVTNNLAAPAVPAYVSSQIANATPSVLEMTYNMTLANISPAASAFTVRVNSTSRIVSSVAVSGTKVSLTLASPVIYGDVVTVAYTKPATNPLQTSSGGQAATISAQSVTNNVVIVNSPPVVLVNYQQSYFGGFIGELNASGSYDINKDNLTFEWIVPENISVSSSNSPQIRFLGPIVNSPKSIEFTLKVSDGKATQVKSIPFTINPYHPELEVAEIVNIEASSFQAPNYPSNISDGNISTMWAADGENQWLILELKETFSIQHIKLAFQPGQKKESYFDILGSKDGIEWEQILTKSASCSFSSDLQIFDFPPSKATRGYNYIKLVGLSNSVDSWNYISEFRLFGYRHKMPTSFMNLPVKVFPNPAFRAVNIKLDEPSLTPDYIRILNFSGSIVYQKEIDPDIRLFQIQFNLKPGIYTIQLVSDNITLYAQRLIVRR